MAATIPESPGYSPLSGIPGDPGDSWLSSQYVSEVVADRLLKLTETTGCRLAVWAPADELRRVPEPGSLHVVVPDLDHALGAQRDEREVLAGVPAAALGLTRVPGAGGGFGLPVPRVAVEGRDERLQLGEQLLARRHRDGADDADASEPALIVVQAEQQ